MAVNLTTSDFNLITTGSGTLATINGTGYKQSESTKTTVYGTESNNYGGGGTFVVVTGEKEVSQLGAAYSGLVGSKGDLSVNAASVLSGTVYSNYIKIDGDRITTYSDYSTPGANYASAFGSENLATTLATLSSNSDVLSLSSAVDSANVDLNKVNYGSSVVTFNAGDVNGGVTVYGSKATTHFMTGDGNDLVSVAEGAKGVVDMGAGTDTLYLAGGNTVTFASGVEVVDAGAAKSAISFTANDTELQTLLGSQADDYISIGSTDLTTVVTNAYIDGGLGGDTIFVGGHSNIIAGGTGQDNISVVGIGNTIYGGEGEDSVYVDGNLNYIDTGSNADYIYVDMGVNTTVLAGEQEDTVILNNVDRAYIDAGDGNDMISITGNDTDNNSTVIGGAGDDTIAIGGAVGQSAEIYLDSTDGNVIGYNVVYVNSDASGEASIVDYNWEYDAIELDDSLTASFETYLKSGKTSDLIFDEDGYISLGSVNLYIPEISVSSNDTGIYAADINDTVFFWGDDDGGSIDLGQTSIGNKLSSREVVVITDNNDDGDSIKGSDDGDFTFYVGEDDTIFSGKGNDVINITADSDGAGVHIGISADDYGIDTINGFRAGWGYGKDVLTFYEDELTAASLESLSGYISDEGTLIDFGNNELLLTGHTNDYTHVNVESSDGTKYKASFIAEGATETVSATEYANFYYGNNSVLFAGYNRSDVFIDMTNSNYFGNDVYFGGTFKEVYGGYTSTAIWGDGSYSQHLIGWNGQSTLFGGYGDAADTLESYNSSQTTYVWGTKCGNDTISGYGSISESYQSFGHSGDVIEIGNTTQSIASYTFDGTNVVVTTTEGNSLTIADNSDDVIIAYGDSGNGTIAGYAKIGDEDNGSKFSYNSKVTEYYGHEYVEDTISIGSEYNTTVQIDATNKTWKDNNGSALGDQRTDYSYIDVYDASASSANVSLIGGDLDETVIGGTGTLDAKLGAGDDFVSLGSSTKGTIYYGAGDGDDTILGAGIDDKVVFYSSATYNVTAADYAGCALDEDGNLSIVFNNGQTLTMNAGTDVIYTFQNYDGTTSGSYKFNGTDGFSHI